MNKETPKRESKTFRLTKYTLRTIDRLAELYDTNRTAIIEQAVAYFDQIQKRGW